MPDAPRFAHRVRDGLLELPVTTARFLIATGRRAVAVTSACCPMRVALAAAEGQSTGWSAERSSISIPGKSTPISRALPASMPGRVSAIMSICSTPKAVSGDCLPISAGGGWTKCFSPRSAPVGQAMRTTIEEVPRLAAASAPLVVRRSHPATVAAQARWDAFAEACPEATFFHRAGWQRILREVFGHRTHFLYAERAGVVEGILPLAQVKSLLFGNSLVSLPFAVYGGVAASNPAAVEALELEAQATARRLGVDHLEMRNLRQRHPGGRRRISTSVFARPLRPKSRPTCRPSRASSGRWSARESRMVCEARSMPILAASSRSTPTMFTGTGHRPCPGAISLRCSGCLPTTAKS
jgi:hypothetical protein